LRPCSDGASCQQHLPCISNTTTMHVHGLHASRLEWSKAWPFNGTECRTCGARRAVLCTCIRLYTSPCLDPTQPQSAHIGPHRDLLPLAAGWSTGKSCSLHKAAPILPTTTNLVPPVWHCHSQTLTTKCQQPWHPHQVNRLHFGSRHKLPYCSHQATTTNLAGQPQNPPLSYPKPGSCLRGHMHQASTASTYSTSSRANTKFMCQDGNHSPACHMHVLYSVPPYY
jgi:hypothetical protein